MALFTIQPKQKPSDVYPKSWELDEEHPSILELTLKFVFCKTLPKKNDLGEDIPDRFRIFSYKEDDQMRYSIDWWKKAADRQRERKIIVFKATPDELKPDEIEMALMRFSFMIRKKEAEDPALMRRVRTFEVNRIDYRKVYKLPGAHTQKDFDRASLILKTWNENNPELS